MRKFIFGLLLLLALPGMAAIETNQFDTPEQEALYKELIEELRCLVCQNQNLADSNAELATDLRRKTYEMVRSGKQRDEIVSYMVQRYGDFVLYRPPVNNSTILLWGGPFLILLLGVVVLFNFIRRQKQQSTTPKLSDEESNKASALLYGDEKEKS